MFCLDYKDKEMRRKVEQGAARWGCKELSFSLSEGMGSQWQEKKCEMRLMARSPVGCWEGLVEAMSGNGGPRKKLSQKFTLGDPVLLIHRHVNSRCSGIWYTRKSCYFCSFCKKCHAGFNSASYLICFLEKVLISSSVMLCFCGFPIIS